MSGTFALTPPRRRSGLDAWQRLAVVVAIAAVLALVAIASGWRGSDLPAQVFRSELIRRDGFVLWNSQWFGGHAVLGYSVLAPALGALTGPLVLGALSGVAAAAVFERILHFTFGRAAWLGAIWFALGTVTNLIVGRTTYALGIALGLGAVYALQRRRLALAVVCALLCSLSSPLAGCFLAVIAAGTAIGAPDRRVTASATFAAAIAPIAALALLFPTSGAEPYEPWALAWDLALCAVVAVALWRYPVVRWTAALFAVAAIGSYLVPTAVGGNVSRFGQYIAGPLLACALFPRRRLVLLGALAIPLLVWQWFPAVDGIAYARTDPSTHASYYQPVVGYLRAQPGAIGRVEIPSTYRHWEAAYAAPKLLLARGWERQLDIGYNPIFYSGPLTLASYHAWLRENGVAYVALPDAQLDDSSLGERQLLLAGAPYLVETWHDAHWRVWKVRDFTGLTDGPASVTKLTPDRITLDVRRPGDLVLRVRATRHWDIQGPGCAAATANGWTLLRGLPVGTVTMTQSLGGESCPRS